MPIYTAPKSHKRIRVHWRRALGGKVSELKIVSLKMTFEKVNERGVCGMFSLFYLPAFYIYFEHHFII